MPVIPDRISGDFVEVCTAAVPVDRSGLRSMFVLVQLTDGEAINSSPERGGEPCAEARRVRHRTVGAADANVRFARQLRRKMSLPEVVLWQQLRKRPAGIRFRRQFPCYGYVVDFACLERRLAIEVDARLIRSVIARSMTFAEVAC